MWAYILILGETNYHHSLSLSTPHTQAHMHLQRNAILKRCVLYLSVNNHLLWKCMLSAMPESPIYITKTEKPIYFPEI